MCSLSYRRLLGSWAESPLDVDGQGGQGRVVEYDQPRTVRIQVLLEDYTDSYGRVERRLAAYELDREGEPGRRIGYLTKGAPRRTGSYLATLHRPGGKRRIEGRLSSLRSQSEH